MLNTKNKILFFILIVLTSLTFGQALIPGEIAPENRSIPEVESKSLDPRAEILSDYFASYNSPLEYHAQDFVDAADEYSVDWKLVPAISGVESTFGKHSYGFNAWGWGIYGDNRLGFTSWREGIFTVTAGLKTGYIDKGLTSPYTMNRVYAASPSWGWKVDYFMKDLEKFASTQKPRANSANPLTKTGWASAQLAYKI